MVFDTKLFEDIVRNKMRKGKVPGLAISITKDDKIIYTKGFGARDLEKNLPMSPNTLIGIGSCTKSFTACAILKLVEQGKLTLEDSASKYLDFPPFSTHPDILIKHMLSHSTGVPAADAGLFPFFYTFGDYKNVSPMGNWDDFFAHLGGADEFIIYKPGEKFFYQNDMFTSLGYIVEQLTGLKYAKFVQNEILAPLGMTRAVFTQEEFEKDSDIMSGYLPGEKNTLQKKKVPLFEFLHAGGGLYVGMEEMMKYARFLLNKGTFNGKQLLKPESLDQIWTPRVSCPYGNAKDPQYASGWVIDEGYYPYTMIQHGGGLGTSCAWLALIPELNIGISIATNCCTGSVEVIGRAALSLLMDLDPFEHEKELRLEKIFHEVEGTYKSPYDMYSFSVKFEGGALKTKVETDDGPMEFSMVIKNEETLEFGICSAIPAPNFVIKFIRNSDSGRVEFVTFDRYLYRRI